MRAAYAIPHVLVAASKKKKSKNKKQARLILTAHFIYSYTCNIISTCKNYEGIIREIFDVLFFLPSDRNPVCDSQLEHIASPGAEGSTAVRGSWPSFRDRTGMEKHVVGPLNSQIQRRATSAHGCVHVFLQTHTHMWRQWPRASRLVKLCLGIQVPVDYFSVGRGGSQLPSAGV